MQIDVHFTLLYYTLSVQCTPQGTRSSLNGATHGTTLSADFDERHFSSRHCRPPALAVSRHQFIIAYLVSLLLRPPAIVAARSIAIGLSSLQCAQIQHTQIQHYRVIPADQSRASIWGRDLISPGWLMEQPSLFQVQDVAKRHANTGKPRDAASVTRSRFKV